MQPAFKVNIVARSGSSVVKRAVPAASLEEITTFIGLYKQPQFELIIYSTEKLIEVGIDCKKRRPATLDVHLFCGTFT